MKTIRISGIIDTWQMSNESNVTPEELNKSLQEANGEDVLILINSPGGSVFAGLEMYSLIQNYNGKTETRIVSMAASMGSIIALAGQKRSAERTASYMIHNASSVAWGDYRDFIKMADELEAVTGHLSNIYTNRANIDNAEVREMMNNETWKYGEDLTDFGFTIVDPEENVDMSTARFNAHNRYNNYKRELLNHAEEYVADIEKAAACVGGVIKNSTKPAVNAVNNKREVQNKVETLEELKAKNPALYNLAIQAGVEQEKNRVAAHAEWFDVAPKEAMAAINNGEEFSPKHASRYAKAQLNVTDVQNRIDDDPEITGSAAIDDSEINDVEQAEYEAKLKQNMGAK